MMKQYDFRHVLQYATMGFWCVFYGVIAFTNACDVLHRRNPRHPLSRFRAHNLDEVETAVATVQTPPDMAGGLFALVIIGQAVGCVLFAAAILGKLAPLVAQCALLWNLLIWQAFVVADSGFRAYQFTVAHTILMCAGLLTAGLFIV